MSKYVCKIVTVQSNAIRILCEALKDILTDVNLQISKDGLKIIAMDGSKSAIINLKLEASKFEEFSCTHDIKVGLNMTSLHKIIKSIKNNDILTLYIKENQNNKLCIEIVNKEKKTTILTELKLLDIDEDILEIPNIKFDSVITMPSNDFQSYIRELSIITNKVKIQSVNSTITLFGYGDFAETKIEIGESCENLNNDNLNITSETFNLKYLLLFTKSTNLCTTVEIYLKNKFPLILIYNVANLGKIQYCLAPLNE